MQLHDKAGGKHRKAQKFNYSAALRTNSKPKAEGKLGCNAFAVKTKRLCLLWRRDYEQSSKCRGNKEQLGSVLCFNLAVFFSNSVKLP